ncbi:MAG: hypothetical protein ACRDNP_15595, partial [Gaiellaceae bacterium]
MQRRALLAVTFAAALAVPVSFAAPPPGKGKPSPTGPGCKPAISVRLTGTLTSDPEFAGAGAFTINTTGANKPGKAFIGGADETITAGADTKVRRQNAPKLIASLESDDRAVVHLRACKGALPLDAAELTALTALRVNAQA